MGASGAGAATSFTGSLWGAYASIEAGKANKQIAQYNARVAELQAVDALATGEQQASDQGVAGRRLIGEQRTAYAGGNVDVNSGSAAEIQTQTAEMTTRDINTIRLNAMRTAWGYQAQAKGDRMQGRLAERAGYMNAAGGLLTGGGAAASQASSARAVS